ncbi:MAG: inositol monophosphatase family protein [Mycobacteriales bacterium]
MSASELSDGDLSRLLEVAVRAARAGAAELSQRAGLVRTVEYKSSGTDPVSDADRAAEVAVVAVLSSERPADGLLGEEGAARVGSTGLRWVVDPLDGTVNYLYGIPQSAVSVACERLAGAEWESIVGCVLDVARGEVFTAVVGGGARLGGATLRVNDPVPLSVALISTGFSYAAASRARQAAVAAELLPKARDIRRFGSCALDLCWLAAGRCDGYYEDELSRWDWAAGALIAAESGAVLSSLGGGLVAAGPWLHPELSAAVSSLA